LELCNHNIWVKSKRILVGLIDCASIASLDIQLGNIQYIEAVGVLRQVRKVGGICLVLILPMLGRVVAYNPL
jgi:hypothetical protein